MPTLVSVDAILPGASTGNTRGKSQPNSTLVSGGVEVKEGERHIAVVWLYPVSESEVTGSVNFKSQHPIEKINAQAFLLCRNSYSLLVRSH